MDMPDEFRDIPDDFIWLAIKQSQPIGSCYPGDDYDYLFEYNGIHYKVKRDRNKVGSGIYPRTWVWEQRIGEPWQAAIEALVRERWEAEYYAMNL